MSKIPSSHSNFHLICTHADKFQCFTEEPARQLNPYTSRQIRKSQAACLDNSPTVLRTDADLLSRVLGQLSAYFPSRAFLPNRQSAMVHKDATLPSNIASQALCLPDQRQGVKNNSYGAQRDED